MAEYLRREMDWEEEANAVISDIKPHVKSVQLSRLPSSKQNIYFNLTTLEKRDFCIELSEGGFNVVGEEYDSTALRKKYPTFETPYTMLNTLSPAYSNSFGQQLMQKLTKLQEDREREEQQEMLTKLQEDREREEQQMLTKLQEDREREKQQEMLTKLQEDREKEEQQEMLTKDEDDDEGS